MSEVPVPRPAIPAVVPEISITQITIDVESVDTALFGWEWVRRLAGTSWVAADRTELADQLRGLTCRLIEALATEPFTPASGITVGEELVAIGFDSPDALARTTTLLTDRFLLDLGLIPDPETTESHRIVLPAWAEDQSAAVGRARTALLRERLALLTGSVCLGFVRAVRDRTLAQQEAIRSSALLAWQRALADQRESALHDPVTGLLNRTGFAERLARLVENNPDAVIGACLLSLDGFAALDRGLGRDSGDRLLTEVAARLATRFSGEHELLARVGRDQFLVVGIDGGGEGGPGDAMIRRQAAAQDVIAEPILLMDRPIVLSTSCGLLARPTGRADSDRILQDVDLAASWARQRGPGGVAVFESTRAARQIGDLALTADLPSAIETGRLLPYFQPIVSLESGRIEAVEALARWPHAEHGLLTPERFLPLAESAGLITTLDRAVLRRACRQARIWQTTLPRSPLVAVNLAAVRLADRRTVREVVAVLEQTGLAPDQLQLEITEHAALDAPETLQIIRDLAGCGVGLALDDFGTGRAHLAQLAELPGHGVRTLKLPADFLRRPTGGGAIADDPARVQVFAAIIDLAHGLGMQVTVEGVETPGHHDLVRELGADQAQGLHYARPDTAVAIGARLLADQQEAADS
jgi:diguanylate cyclase (GGDEF)-like protein